MEIEGDVLGMLMDRLEIVDLLTRYATAVDSRDWDLLASIFTPDAYCDYTDAGWIRGPIGEIVATFRNNDNPDDPTVTQHIITNHVVEIDGDHAQARAYLHAQHTFPTVGGTPSLFTFGGIYDDEFVRSEGRWNISRLSLRNLWVRGSLET